LEIPTEQVKVEEKQRGFGIIPNFFEVFDPHPAPLTSKLKYSLAFKFARDPFTKVGVGLLAGIGQVAGSLKYVGGMKGHAERLGANYTNDFTDIMIGGAFLPSLLRQDPRYYYQGRGTKKSRALHAISNLIIAKGDNGHLQPNYSSLGGDLASAGISNVYYPEGIAAWGRRFRISPSTSPYRWAPEYSRSSFIGLRNKVKADLLPYVQCLRARWVLVPLIGCRAKS
jgi:hypothetical protein